MNTILRSRISNGYISENHLKSWENGMPTDITPIRFCTHVESLLFDGNRLYAYADVIDNEMSNKIGFEL